MRSAFALFLVLLAPLALAQGIQLAIVSPAELGEGQPAEWHLLIRNTTTQPIEGALLTLLFDDATLVRVSPMESCQPSPPWQLLRCPLPTLQPETTIEVIAEMRLPFRYGRVRGAAQVSFLDRTGGAGDSVDRIYWRDFLVTSTADSGPGTLRQAILDINSECDAPLGQPAPSCRAAFDIEQKLGGDFFHTVQLVSPLPALNVPRSSIDGSTEDASNTMGPSVAIDGSRLGEGNGITVAKGECDIRSIAIGNFPWNGIHATGVARVNVDRAHIGVNALGLVATPNGSRGIATERVAGRITNCLIAGNRRSGIFMTGPRGGSGVEIRNNRIGVAPVNGLYGIGNGASGIYIGEYSRDFFQTYIEDNVIAGNAHFGLALSPKALVIAQRNRIYANGGAGIDIGLDGRTEGVGGVPGQGRVYPPPAITSATFADGQTTIRGTVEPSTIALGTSVQLYANSELEADGFAEAEQYLGTVNAESGAFSLTVPRDLRGLFVNGLTLRNEVSPSEEIGAASISELGRAIPVQ